MPRLSRFLCPLILLPLSLALGPVRAMAQSGPRARATAVFHRLHLLDARTSLLRTAVSAPGAAPGATSGALSSASRARLSQGSFALTAGDLQFSFQSSGDNAFTAAQRSKLQNFLSANYARMTAIYGQPAPEQRGQTVTVFNGPASADYAPPLPGGTSGGGRIQFLFNDAASDALNFYNFTRLALTAFQGPRVPAFNFRAGNYVEPWLFGASDAAALLVSYGAAGSPANFNPSTLDFYVLPVYDFLNRPDLGNAYIYSRNGADLVVSDFRRAMAQATFSKIAIENPNFFAQFNAALYAQGAAGDPVSPAQLEAIAASVVPTVEGQKFNDWARRQYVLDSSVRTGQKLYLAVTPFVAAATGNDLRSGFRGFAEAFTTGADGDENLSTGYGSVRALDETGRDISSFSSEISANNVLDFSGQQYPNLVPGQANFGAGFTDFGAPSRALVSLRARYGEAEAVSYFPYGVAGNAVSTSSYYGGTLGAQNGVLQLEGSASEAVPVTRGAWMGNSPYASGPRVQTQFSFGGAVLRRNTAWLVPGAQGRSVGFLLQAPANLRTLTFALPTGSSNLRMISLPFTPLQTDEVAALGLGTTGTNGASTGVPLARYVPNLSPATLQNNALIFGVGGDQYELYPNISMPLEAGRGYWVNADAVSGPVSVVGGDTALPGAPVEVPLSGGWNQVGVPLNSAFDVSAIQVRYGGFSAVSLAEAQGRGWVAPGIWRWLPDGGYVRVDVAGGQLQPFEGYFIFAGAAQGVTLVFDSSAASGSAALAAPGALSVGTSSLSAPGSWSLSLVASGQTSQDTAARFGVSNGPNIAGPPPAARVVTLRFDGADAEGAASGSGLAESYVPSLAQGASWNATVDGTQAGENVTLSWDKSAIPRDVSLTLVDAATGARTAMNSANSYDFTATQTPIQFLIEAAPIAPQVAPPIVSTPTVPTPTPTPTATTVPQPAATPTEAPPTDGPPTATTPAATPPADAGVVAPTAPANGAPSANGGSLSVGAGTVGSLVLSGSDPDGDAISFEIVGAPVHGQAQVAYNPASGTWRLVYSGRAGFTGRDKVRVVAVDPSGARSAAATINVMVVPDYVWRRSPAAQGGSGGNS